MRTFRTVIVHTIETASDGLSVGFGFLVGKIVAGEMAVEDPVATLFGRYFTVRTEKRKIDHSWTVGELEHLQKDAVIEYLQMPERVKNVECQIEALRSDVLKLTEALSRLYGLDGDGQSSAPKSQGGNSYVS